MKQQIASLDYKPRLVLHCCCAPCSSAVLEKLVEHFQITMLYYNPNIYPQQEYELRKTEFKKLGVEVVDLGYNHDEYLNTVLGYEKDNEGGQRCCLCIEMRMKKAFEYAKQHKAEFCSTTLSISPHKNAEFINITGEKLAKIYNVEYLYADFKKEKGYLRSIEICKEKGIYRQEYCGCEFAYKHKSGNSVQNK